MDLGGEIAVADDRRQQRGDRLAGAVLDLGLDRDLLVGAVGVAALVGGAEQMAGLIDHRHVVGRHAADRRGDEMHDRLDLTGAERLARTQRQHHRSLRLGVVTQEHAGLVVGDMDLRGLHRVDGLDRTGEIHFLGLLEARALDGTAGAHRQVGDEAVPIRRRFGQALLREQHFRPIIAVFGDGEGTRSIVDAVLDPGGVERRDDARLVGVAEPREEIALRPLMEHHPDQRGGGEEAEHTDHRQALGDRRLAGKAHRAVEQPAIPPLPMAPKGTGRLRPEATSSLGVAASSAIFPTCS